MADMQQLERAFLKAHKAGDKKAAGVLAAEIKKQRAAPQGEVSGLMDQFWSGMESNTELPGVTLETFGKTAGSDTLQGAGTWLRGVSDAPKDFVSASDRFVNPQQGDSYVDPILGFGWGNAAGAGAEVAGQMAGDLAVRSAGSTVGGAVGGVATGGPGAVPGAVVGGLAAPGILEFMRVAGPVAVERAKNDGRSEPNWDDWKAAAATAGLSGLLNSIGIKGIGKLNDGVVDIGRKTVTDVGKEAITETGKKAGREGITETGQSIVQQSGETAFTDKGLTIDLKQAVGEGILGAGAGGVIDAGRNAKPVFDAAMDIRSVDSSMRNNPDAQMQAEITGDVNNIADRMQGSKKDPLSQEVNRYASDLKRQIAAAIDGQNLDTEDKKALKGGMTDATGLTEDRLNEIAGRSESPNEIKALARKIQVIREMTMQKQTAKGLRGWAAMASSTLGGAAGAAVGGSIGGVYGGVAGAQIGQNIGRDISRRLRGNQTQGNAIDALVGKKQARRAKLLLERYGPSEATNALNTLTAKADANKAAAEAEAQAKQDFDDTMAKIRQWQSMREKSRKAEEQAKTKEEREKARAEKAKGDSAYREIRLKDMATRAQINAARHQKLVQDLEHKTATNALTVELQQLRNELAQKQAQAKAEGMDRAKQEDIARIKGKMEMASLEIQKRQQALKKAEIATKRAQIQLDRLESGEKPKVQRMAKSAKVRQAFEEANSPPVGNERARRETMEMMDGERAKIEAGIQSEADQEFRALLRGLYRQLENIKNNNAERKQAYEEYLDAAASLGPKYRNRMEDLFDRFATYQFKNERTPSGAPSSPDVGNLMDTWDYRSPPAPQREQVPPPTMAPQPQMAPQPEVVEPPVPQASQEQPAEAPKRTWTNYGQLLSKPKNSHHMFIGDFGFSFESNGKGRYLWLTSQKGQNLFQSSDGGDADTDTTHVWQFKDPNEGNKRTGPKVGIESLDNNVPPDLIPVFRAWLNGEIDENEAVARIKKTERGS
jgi:hypothetical protein